MSTNVDELFKKYLKEISLQMIDDKSSYQKQMDKIESQFLRYGLTNEQFASVIAEINGKATQYITQYANASAMELIKLELNQPLLEAQIKLAEKDLEIKDKELLIKDKDLELKDKELVIKDKELVMMDKEIAIKEKELEIKTEELKLMYQKIEESKAKVDLIREQVVTEKKQQSMLVSQSKLVDRQTLGYNDNLLIKAAEYEGSLASFAVNSAPTNSTTNEAIKNFRQTINQIKSRS